MSVDIEVVDDPARACAAILLGASAGAGDVVLAGGSTPKAAYHELVNAVGAVGVDLTETTLWFGDERCVAPDDERANFRMVKEALLDPLGGANQPLVRRIPGELGPAAAADSYERDLRDAGPPRFELVLLGIGSDGHTASLFPGQQTIHERTRLVVGVEEAGLEPFVPRVSMTLPALADSELIVVLASGAGKADVVASAFGPSAEPRPEVPASLVAAEGERVIVLLDPAAATGL